MSLIARLILAGFVATAAIYVAGLSWAPVMRALAALQGVAS